MAASVSGWMHCAGSYPRRNDSYCSGRVSPVPGTVVPGGQCAGAICGLTRLDGRGAASAVIPGSRSVRGSCLAGLA